MCTLKHFEKEKVKQESYNANFTETSYRSSRPEMFCKLGVLRTKACNLIKKETLAQMFSYEFCQIS